MHAKEDLYDFLLSPVIDVNDLYFIDENTAWLSWNYTEDAVKSIVSTESRHLSLITGAYVTSHARLRIHSEMMKLSDRLLYTDTDSLIYIETDDPTEYRPKIGSNIGELTDEIAKLGKDLYISAFCSGGPKFYSLQIKNKTNDKVTEVSKLKGFICTEATKKQLCFNNYKKMVFGCCDADGAIDGKTIYSKTKNINRKKYFNVVTTEQTKKFRFTFDKRVVRDNYTTTPFGYKQ